MAGGSRKHPGLSLWSAGNRVVLARGGTLPPRAKPFLLADDDTNDVRGEPLNGAASIKSPLGRLTLSMRTDEPLAGSWIPFSLPRGQRCGSRAQSTRRPCCLKGETLLTRSTGEVSHPSDRQDIRAKQPHGVVLADIFARHPAHDTALMRPTACWMALSLTAARNCLLRLG